MKLSADRQKRLNKVISNLEMEILLGMVAGEIDEALKWRTQLLHPVTNRPWEVRMDLTPSTAWD